MPLTQANDITPLLRRAGIPPHPRLPVHPSHPRATAASSQSLGAQPRAMPWGVIEPKFAPAK
jgi:hypothetical protein